MVAAPEARLVHGGYRSAFLGWCLGLKPTDCDPWAWEAQTPLFLMWGMPRQTMASKLLELAPSPVGAPCNADNSPPRAGCRDAWTRPSIPQHGAKAGSSVLSGSGI